MDNLTKKIKEKYFIKGKTFHKMRDAFNILIREKQSAANTVSRFVGGVYVDRSVAGQEGAEMPFVPVPYITQKKALQILDRHVFSINKKVFPDSLINYLQFQRRGFNFYGTTEDPKIHQMVLSLQKRVLNHLFHPRVLQRIIDTNLYGNELTIAELFKTLRNSIFKNNKNGIPDTFRKNLQIEYINRLINIYGANSKNNYDNLSRSAAFTELNKINKEIRKKRRNTDALQHFSFLEHIINKALKGEKQRK